jgi:hypothetical protein
MSTRKLTQSEIEKQASLDESGINYALLFLTETGLRKSILDATTAIVQLLETDQIHSYRLQQQGENHKVVLPCILLTGNERVETKVSLYRPVTKEGDPRLWTQYRGRTTFLRNVWGIRSHGLSLLIRL